MIKFISVSFRDKFRDKMFIIVDICHDIAEIWKSSTEILKFNTSEEVSYFKAKWFKDRINDSMEIIQDYKEDVKIDKIDLPPLDYYQIGKKYIYKLSESGGWIFSEDSSKEKDECEIVIDNYMFIISENNIKFLDVEGDDYMHEILIEEI